MPHPRSEGPEETPTGKRMKDLATTSTSAIAHESKGEHETMRAANYRVKREEVERLIQEWPEAPKEAAKKALERYGEPNEATPTKLFWYDVDPWKRYIITADILTHHFPMPHTDFVWSTIDYKVPIDKFDDVTQLDGSCIPDRTAGEVTARCDSEWANIVTLNMMHDVVTGAKTPEQARKAFADIASAYAVGNPASEAERLKFDVPHGGTEDVDESMVAGSMAKEGVKKMVDAVTGQR